ncbi:MAG: class I SAM-dependent methyltransferase [Planctomycetes bacterium]|nr:class I SAM-dependent methyltransferase [Planctomycetota bacterium]
MSLSCRSCQSGEVRPFLDLGRMPLSDGLRHHSQLGRPEPRYPLEVAFCAGCSLVQITTSVDPKELFCNEYPYYSSFSDSLLRHSEANVDALCRERRLGPSSFVLELASNDGYLLQYFQARGVPVLGIDPAEGPVKAALARGIPTRQAFFTRALAEQLVAEGRRADVIVGNNVMAHVPDLNGFVAGIAALLKPDGTTSIEAPYVRDLIEHCEFDTIYHEHLCYFSVTAVARLFARHGLHLNRVVGLPIHGGSLRYHASPTPAPDGSVERYLAAERAAGVDRFAFYAGFGERVRALRESLRTLVFGLRAQGKRIAAYGAAAKGAILVNYVGLGPDVLEFCVDRNVHKQGRWLPGVDVPILAPEELLARRPDYTLLLPWNLEREIVAQQQAYLAAGGRFIVPVPEPRIVGRDGAS